jgi:hypothetical protein
MPRWEPIDPEDFDANDLCPHPIQGICAECRWELRILTYYGLSMDDYRAILARQGGGCGICGSVVPKHPNGRFVVDHDHTTGKVRGLLCWQCNTALGQFGDDATYLERALRYLAGEF